MTNTPYDVKISPIAERQLMALSTKSRQAAMKLIELLAMNPRPPGVRKIDGMTGLYCEEVDAHRLIYKVEDQEVLLLLVK